MAHGFCDWWRLISSALGVVAGALMFVLLFVVWGNHTAGVWALISGVFAAVSFHITYLHFRNSIDAWHSVDTLQGITLLGVMVTVCGAAGFIWYIFVALYYHIPVLPMSSSAYITAVWAGMTFKFGLFLIFTSRSYINEIYRENPRLLSA